MSTTTCCMDSMMLKLLLPPNTLQQHAGADTDARHTSRRSHRSKPVRLRCYRFKPVALFSLPACLPACMACRAVLCCWHTPGEVVEPEPQQHTLEGHQHTQPA